MATGEKGKAAELLGALFASQDVPKSFLAILLMDSVPLLEGRSCLASVDLTDFAQTRKYSYQRATPLS